MPNVSKAPPVVLQTSMGEVQIQPQARPVDTFVQPVEKPAGSGQDILQSLRAISPAVESYLGLQESQADLNRKLGAMDRLLGRPASSPNRYSNLGWGYNQGYSMADGEARGIAIQQEYLQRLEAANYFSDDPDELSAKNKREALLKEITAGHLQGTTNVHVVGAASDHILRGNLEGEQEAYKRFNQQKINNLLNSQMSIARQMVKDLRPTLLADMGKSRSDPAFKPDWTAYREQLSHLKRTLEANGVATGDAARLTIATIGQLATEAAADDPLLAKALVHLLRQPDASGFTYDTIVEKGPNGSIRMPYRDMIDSLEADVRSIVTQQASSVEADYKEKKHTADAYLKTLLLSGGDWTTKAIQLQGDGIEVDWGELQRLNDRYAQGYNYSARDDGPLRASLLSRVDRGEKISRTELDPLNQQGILSVETLNYILQQSREEYRFAANLAETQRANTQRTAEADRRETSGQIRSFLRTLQNTTEDDGRGGRVNTRQASLLQKDKALMDRAEEAALSTYDALVRSHGHQKALLQAKKEASTQVSLLTNTHPPEAPGSKRPVSQGSVNFLKNLSPSDYKPER